MSEVTQSFDHPEANRTLAALSLALASGVALGDVEIDLSDPAQCRFGAYTLVERIGGGGMGVVYRAHQESLERDVAIKLLNVDLSEDAEALARFRFEAKSAAALNHPSIVQVLEIGQQQGIAFIAMQLVRGETLADRIARERLSPKYAVALLLKLCDAVGYAHKLHLLHLDLKPANVLIDERGEPLVADFGLARRMNAQGQVQAQEVSGTPAYMAPEQVLIKEFRLSAATDIYALGAILYEMVCGISPHGRGSTAEVMRRALAGQIPSPRQFVPNLPRDIEAICLKCLALDANERYPTAEALAEDLRRYANALPVSVRTPTTLERLQRWYAREPRFAQAMTALLVVALAGSAMLGWLYREAKRARSGADGVLALAAMMIPPTGWDGRSYVGWRTPDVDCLLREQRCLQGNLPGSIVDLDDPTLPDDGTMTPAEADDYIANTTRQLESLRGWQYTSLPFSYTLVRASASAHRSERARALAALDGVDGALFGFMLVNQPGDTFYGEEKRFYPDKDATAWVEGTLPHVTKAWQAEVLAESCRPRASECRAAIARFRALDPDNAAAWMLGLQYEPRVDAEAHLLRAASAPRLDDHAADILDAATEAAARVLPTIAPKARIEKAIFVLQLWNAVPPLSYPIGFCRLSLAGASSASVRDACEHVLAKVQPDMKPRLADELTAAIVLKRMAADPASEARAWKRFRDARWVYSTYMNLQTWQRDADPNQVVRAYRNKGEFAYLQSRLAAAGIALEAPADFVTREPVTWTSDPVPASWR